MTRTMRRVATAAAVVVAAATAWIPNQAAAWNGDDPESEGRATVVVIEEEAAPPAYAAATGVQPGDGFGAASPEIFEPESGTDVDPGARQHNEWLESIWNTP